MLVDSREIEGQILTTPIIDFSPQFHNVGEYRSLFTSACVIAKMLAVFHITVCQLHRNLHLASR
jgi:hypothetical protein